MAQPQHSPARRSSDTPTTHKQACAVHHKHLIHVATRQLGAHQVLRYTSNTAQLKHNHTCQATHIMRNIRPDTVEPDHLICNSYSAAEFHTGCCTTLCVHAHTKKALAHESRILTTGMWWFGRGILNRSSHILMEGTFAQASWPPMRRHLREDAMSQGRERLMLA